MPVFAESAPVYDADSVQQQFDQANAQQDQDLPPPPSPEQDNSDSGYVPPQPQAATTPTLQQPSLTMEQRMRRVEQQVNNMQNSDSSARTQSLQSEVQSLRAQVEQLTHQLQQIQNQQKSMYADLDKRLQQAATTPAASSKPVTSKPTRKLAAAKSVNAPTATPNDNAASTDVVASTSSDQSQPNVAEEQQIYQTAYNLIKAKKYNEAVNELQEMLQKYPSGQFASNAHYWLGELYGLMGKNDQALTEFNTVVKNYPDSPRVSDAQLKVGLIYASQFKWADAKSAFKNVINHYPGTASARLASEQIKQIKQAGH